MPRKNRCELFNPLEVSVNHCTAKCVRQEFLIEDRARRLWMVDKLKSLCQHFLIDAFSIAFMSNHIHLILRNRPDIVEELSDVEIATRWLSLTSSKKAKSKSKGKPKGNLEADPKPTDSTFVDSMNESIDNDVAYEPSEKEIKALVKDKKKLKAIRIRLSDISWLMRFFCQYVAVRANREDGVTGRFWQGRFFSQPLIDEEAILACAVYIELNPIRAGIANSIEECEFTSVMARIRALHMAKQLASMNHQGGESLGANDSGLPDAFLAPVQLDPACPIDKSPSKTKSRASDRGFLNYTAEQYIELVLLSAQMYFENIQSERSTTTPSILNSLKVSIDSWKQVLDSQNQLFRRQKEVELKSVLIAV